MARLPKLTLGTRLKNLIIAGGSSSKISKPQMTKMTITDTLSSGTRIFKEYAGTVANVGKSAGRTVMTWGRVAKASVVAAGGVVAYYLFQGGLVGAVSGLLGTSEEESQIILVIVGIILLLLFLNGIIRKLGSRRRSSHYVQSPRKYKKKRYSGGRN